MSTSEPRPLIRIRDLRYGYAEGPDVLRIPSLDVSGSGLIAVTGPSGAGKSTLVELLAGTLHEPYEGTVEVLGREWRELKRDADRQRQIRRIGFIPQDFGILPERTPREMIEQDLSDSGVPEKERALRAGRALGVVGLNEFANQRISSLSGGQGQRVAIARMLARDVDLVIADEPTANLDPGLRDVVMGLLRQLSQQVPVVVVTHDAAVAERCDRTIILQAAVSAPERPATARPRVPRKRVLGIATGLLIVAGAATTAVSLSRTPTQASSSGLRRSTRTGSTTPLAHHSKKPPANKKPSSVTSSTLAGPAVTLNNTAITDHLLQVAQYEWFVPNPGLPGVSTSSLGWSNGIAMSLSEPKFGTCSRVTAWVVGSWFHCNMYAGNGASTLSVSVEELPEFRINVCPGIVNEPSYGDRCATTGLYKGPITDTSM
jgi:putative ABC transport system ATP-binding protein